MITIKVSLIEAQMPGLVAEDKLTLEGRVGTDGFLKDLRVLAPADAEFANAALEAVRQWQFTPTRLDGVRMEVRMRVTVNSFMDQ